MIMKKTPWQQALATPQTYALMVGILMGFGGLVGVVGNRTLVWVGGSGLSLAMLGSWVWGFRPGSASSSGPVQMSQDWLHPESLKSYLTELEQSLPAPENSTWCRAKAWAGEVQTAAQRIVEQDPLLHVDIVETLHTVMGLVAQIAETLRIQAQLQTPIYRTVAQQHLQASCDRLQDSNAQLQQLQDQLMLSKLERSEQESPLPQHLQTLIAANKVILEQPLKPLE